MNFNRFKYEIINNNPKLNLVANTDLKNTKFKSQDYIKDNSKNKFHDLPLIKDFSKKSKLGKIDPFENNFAVPTENTIRLISLLGVYSTSKKKYAILRYKDKTGDIFEGNIG